MDINSQFDIIMMAKILLILNKVHASSESLVTAW